MSNIADRALIQDATLWTVSPDNFGGDTFGSPVPVKCRWEDRNEKFTSPTDPSEQVSRSIVFLDRNANVGDYLFLGTSVASDPSVVVGAFKIRRFDKCPNLRNLLIVKKAYL